MVLQGVDRLAMADEVWLAVCRSRRSRDSDSQVRKLCCLIGFGLLSIDPRNGSAEVLAEPGPYRPCSNARRRSLLLEEHRRRHSDPAAGGSARTPIMTACRQHALACASALRGGPCRTQDLRSLVPDAAAILLRNVYGWFEREARGVDRLTPSGTGALLHWLPAEAVRDCPGPGTPLLLMADQQRARLLTAADPAC